MFTQDNSTFEIEVILNLRCYPLKFTQKGVTSSFKPKGTKATGPDQIPGHLLKEVACPEILLESVATQTYCISLLYVLLELYSKITKIVPAILDSYFQVVNSPIRNASSKGEGGWEVGCGGGGGTTHANKKQKVAF